MNRSTGSTSLTEDLASRDSGQAWLLLFAGWAVALISTCGALFIGEIMGQTPCLLCWYQRILMFPLAVILAVACYASDVSVWRYALPLAAIGWLVAAYHNLLFFGFIPESIQPCGQGPSCSSADLNLIGFIPIPTLSFGAFSILLALFICLSRSSRS